MAKIKARRRTAIYDVLIFDGTLASIRAMKREVPDAKITYQTDFDKETIDSMFILGLEMEAGDALVIGEGGDASVVNSFNLQRLYEPCNADGGRTARTPLTFGLPEEPSSETPPETVA